MPALDRLCRRLTGFGADRVVPEQAAALEAMAAIGGKEARVGVARLLAERVVQGPTLAVALRAAGRLGVSLPPPCLTELLHNPRPEVRAGACRCIRSASAHFELLVELLGDLHPEVATSAAIALGRTGRIEGLPMLTALLLHEPSAELIDAVVPIADEKVITILGRIAQETPSLRQTVLDALEQIGNPRAAMVAAGVGAWDAPPEGRLTEGTSMARVSYIDLRGFIDQVDRLRALRHIDGADPYLEIGGITEVAAALPDCPALLFDRIKGYPKGFRIFTNATTNVQRAALALGIDPALGPLDALKSWMEVRGALEIRKPVQVDHAYFLENSDVGDAVDLGKFPIPHWHLKDGGPYIGAGSLVIMRDPDSVWVNASIYRVQVHTRNRVTIQFDHQGSHGAIIAKKYWDQGKACPVAVVNGEDPALFIAGFEYLPEGRSEYDFAGAIKGEAVQVYSGPETGLPDPVHAEIVLEGDLLLGVTLAEGPFGEFTGYYASEARPSPVMEVRAVHYRNDPILFDSPSMKPPRFHFGLPIRAATIWSNLSASGVTDIVGAWQHVAQLMTVVALKQRYAGHAKRAALIAAAHSYMGRMVVVVDEDVDPSDLVDVMWAIATRCEPSESVDIIRDAWSSSLDPRIPPERRLLGATSHSKMIIDACKPFAWLSQFRRPRQ